MKILENIPLAPYTSLFVGGPARYFAIVSSVADLVEALRFARVHNIKKVHVLGGGCNTVFSDRGFNGLVLKVAFKSLQKVKETKTAVFFEVGAGENWDGFVRYAVQKGLYGIENLSYVPGSVGAAAIQNIGCYGQEASETIAWVRLFDAVTGKVRVLNAKVLRFGYRRSILNTTSKGRYVVLDITFRLQKSGKLNLDYGDLAKYFALRPNVRPSLETVRRALIHIRNSKFPFPKSPTTGTAGSFFKAREVGEKTFFKIVKTLKQKGFTDKAAYIENRVASFRVKQGYKVPYGLLIDSLGFKGRRVGGAKVLESHADILGNWNGTATAKDFLTLARLIQKKVESVYGVELLVEPEVVEY